MYDHDTGQMGSQKVLLLNHTFSTTMKPGKSPRRTAGSRPGFVHHSIGLGLGTCPTDHQTSDTSVRGA